MKATVLDNSMFDDGSLDCKTFGLSNSETTYYAEWATVQHELPTLVEAIKAAVARDENYITVPNDIETEWLEVTWD
jgi:hypothetical protein